MPAKDRRFGGRSLRAADPQPRRSRLPSSEMRRPGSRANDLILSGGIPSIPPQFHSRAGRSSFPLRCVGLILAGTRNPHARGTWDMRRSRIALLLPLLAVGLHGADWPQFRGPYASGLCPSCGRLPTEFGPQKNVLWKTDLPVGKSSPILVGDRILLTASEGDDRVTICL